MFLLDLVFLFLFHTPLSKQPTLTDEIVIAQVKDEDPVIFPEPSCFGPKGNRECF